MKFLKVSLVIFFLLSLASCGLTLYLSTVRENEKEKRLQLEQIRTQLEQQVSSLESDKQEAQRQISDLNTQVGDLEEQLQKEQAERSKMGDLLRTKEGEVKSVRSEMAEVDKAFANAQKRNRQLEQILDELEARVKELEAQKIPAEPETGYIQLNVTPQGKPAQTIPANISSSPESAAAPSVGQPSTTAASLPSTMTTSLSSQAVKKQIVPEKSKKKKKGLFSFLKFGRGKNKTPKEDIPPGWESPPSTTAVQKVGLPSTTTASSEKISKSSRVVVGASATTAQNSVPPQAVPPKLPSAQVKPVSVPVVKTESPSATVFPSRKEEASSGGHILLVNRKFNFVVVDLGSKQGLVLDDMLVIEKNGVSAAKARVEKLYDDYCAAYLVEEQSETPLEEGDLVRPV